MDGEWPFLRSRKIKFPGIVEQVKLRPIVDPLIEIFETGNDLFDMITNNSIIRLHFLPGHVAFLASDAWAIPAMMAGSPEVF